MREESHVLVPFVPYDFAAGEAAYRDNLSFVFWVGKNPLLMSVWDTWIEIPTIAERRWMEEEGEMKFRILENLISRDPESDAWSRARPRLTN